MSNFFTEIELCLREGVAFDLLWDLPGLQLSGYREVVRVREDGKVQIRGAPGESLLDQARTPVRPAGAPPRLHLELSTKQGNAPLKVRALAEVTQTSAPVYYTHGADREGVYHNAYVAWELYGPHEEDYRFVTPEGLRPQVTRRGQQVEVVTDFSLKQPGTYRLRAATVDLSGRSTVVWTSIVVSE